MSSPSYDFLGFVEIPKCDPLRAHTLPSGKQRVAGVREQGNVVGKADLIHVGLRSCGNIPTAHRLIKTARQGVLTVRCEDHSIHGTGVPFESTILFRFDDARRLSAEFSGRLT